MIQAKTVIFGHITRIEGNKAYVRNGDTVTMYNLDYYRIVSE